RPPHLDQARAVDVGDRRARRRHRRPGPGAGARLAHRRRHGGRVSRGRESILTRRERWAPTHALLRCVAVVLLTAPVALLWRRPDLLVLAAPFAVVLAWSLVTRPQRPPEHRFALSHSLVREGQQVVAVAQVEPVEGAEIIAAAVSPA